MASLWRAPLFLKSSRCLEGKNKQFLKHAYFIYVEKQSEMPGERIDQHWLYIIKNMLLWLTRVSPNRHMIYLILTQSKNNVDR